MYKAKIVPFTKVVWLLIQHTHKPTQNCKCMNKCTHSSLNNASTKHHLNIPSPLPWKGVLLTPLVKRIFLAICALQTHGTYHGKSVLTVFLKLLFRQYILWCDGYQASHLSSLHMLVTLYMRFLLVTLYAFLLWGLSSLWLFIYLSLAYCLYSSGRLLLLYRKCC